MPVGNHLAVHPRTRPEVHHSRTANYGLLGLYFLETSEKLTNKQWVLCQTQVSLAPLVCALAGLLMCVPWAT